VIISHEHQFVFLKTRKTAGTSVEIALSTVCGPDDVITPILEEDEELRRAAGGRGPQNHESPPLQRRAYNHMPAQMVRQLLGRERWERYFSFSIERNPWDAVVSLYHWRYRDASDPMPFEEFVVSPMVENYATKNARIYRLKGDIAVDRVCRYESLADDVNEVWRQLELPGEPDLPRAKGGVRPAGSYAAYYDENTAARVQDLFAPMIRDLGYTLDR
jgi:hypothetical protein